VDGAVEDDASADARADEHTEEIRVRAPGPAAMLASHGRSHVVVEHHRNAGDLSGDERPELDRLGEAGDVR
jgi:hypothetical protein